MVRISATAPSAALLKLYPGDLAKLTCASATANASKRRVRRNQTEGSVLDGVSSMAGTPVAFFALAALVRVAFIDEPPMQLNVADVGVNGARSAPQQPRVVPPVSAPAGQLMAAAGE